VDIEAGVIKSEGHAKAAPPACPDCCISQLPSLREHA